MRCRHRRLNVDFQDLRSYFEDIIKKYLPYKESKMYQVLIDFLVETYLKDLYDENLSNFKELFEENNILTDIYDQLLLGIGVPQKVLNELNFNHKIIFLGSLSDFQRYKSTTTFFQNVATSFADKFNIYELYVDYEEGQWVFKPYIIHSGSPFSTAISSLEYQEIYEEIPSLLISEDQLDSLRDNNDAVFPIKSNLLLLDYNIYKEVSTFGNLIVSTLLKEYGSFLVTVYFSDENFDFTLKDLYYIWYYIITRYYETVWLKFNLQKIIRYSEVDNPYTMAGIDDLISDFEELDNSADIAEFYEENIALFFRTLFQSPEQTEEDMANIVRGISEEFYDYINNRLDSLTGDDLSQEVNSMLTEIYTSLFLFYRNNSGDQYILKYFETLLYALPQILVEPESTISYTILHNFKPFHVEFVSKIRESIVSEDKLNTITPKDTIFSFLEQLIHTEFVGNLDDINLSYTTFNGRSTLDVLSSASTLYEHNVTEELSMSDDFEVIY